MSGYLINIGITYLFIGFSVALLFFFAFKKKFIGNLPAALAMGIVGAFLGGLVNYFFRDLIKYLSTFNDVNVFASVFTAALIVWLFSAVSGKRDS